MARKLVCLWVLLLAPCSVFAAQGVFDVPITDSSMQYLGNVFGAMGTLPVGADGSPLFADMIQIMNKIIFFLGIVIVLYTGMASTIQTAQEGEVMGKKWSTIWVPVRGALGLFLLLPSPGSGYSFIQITVMYLIIQGVGAANAIWERVIYSVAVGDSIVATSNASAELRDPQMLFIKQFLESELCAYIVNNTEEITERFENEPVVFFKVAGSNTKMVWGLESSGLEVCGSIQVPPLSAAMPQEFGSGVIPGVSNPGAGSGIQYSEEPLQRIHRSMMESVSYAVQPIAEESLLFADDPSSWTTPGNVSLITRTFKNGYLDIHNYYNSVRNDLSNILDFAKVQGWIHAGNYYSRLVKQNANMSRPASYPPVAYAKPNYEFIAQDPQGAANLSSTIMSTIDSIERRANAMLGTVQVNTTIAAGTTGGAGQDEMGAEMGDLTNMLKDLALDIIDSMTGGTGVRDPLVPISQTGLKIMEVVEWTFWALIIAIPLLAIASIPPCVSPLWGVFTTIGLFAMTLFTILGPMLYTAGVILGLYVPLIPFLVYTFSAIAWIILVIEAIVAAPLIALVLVVPSEDEIGKAGHSLVILLGLIFRPALMVLGFILGAKVMFVMMGMIDFGFRSLIIDNMGYLGVFGSVAIVIIYCGVVTTVVHQSFSLIYNVPDKVLRWMGGQPETQDVSSKVQQIKGSAEKGASASGGMMKGGVAAGQKALK